MFTDRLYLYIWEVVKYGWCPLINWYVAITIIDRSWISSRNRNFVGENCPDLFNKFSWAWHVCLMKGMIGLRHKVTVLTGSCNLIVHLKKYIIGSASRGTDKVSNLFSIIIFFHKMFVLGNFSQWSYKSDRKSVLSSSTYGKDQFSSSNISRQCIVVLLPLRLFRVHV